MSSRRFSTVLAAVGASGALIAGGLAFGGSAASADTTMVSKTATYACSAVNQPLGSVPITFNVPAAALAVPLTQGQTIPAGVPFTSSSVVPQSVIANLGALLATIGMSVPTSIGGPITGNAFLGSQALPLSATLPDTPLSSMQADGLHLDNIAGTIAAFAPAKSGAQDLKLPTDLNLQLLGASLPGADCTYTSGDTTVGTVTVAPGKPVISATAPKTAKVGKAVTVKVVVKNATTGKVTAKLGKKAFSAPLKAGKASVVVKGIKKGVNKIVVSFPKAASKTLKVTGK